MTAGAGAGLDVRLFFAYVAFRKGGVMGMAMGAVERVEITVGAGEDVPLLGAVAAGVPLQAFTVEDVLTVPPGMWSGRKVFALRVRGTSMIDEGIRDGDHLIVEPRERADDGQTVVAEVDG